jgi:hypothetical protein
MSLLRHIAERVAKDATRLIGIHWGEAFPFYYVSEFPKSGGTWVARMVGDYLQLPFPQLTVFPLGFRCVVQNHWTHHPKLQRVFYVYRDGRDVMTSYFFERIRVARHSDRAGRERVGRIYERVLGKDYDSEDSVRLLPKFIEFEFARPGRGSRVNWRDHIESWYDPPHRRHIAYLSYEALLHDCVGSLSRALEQITGESIDPWRIETTVEKFSMKRQTGRKPGEEDITQHARKGVVGDWRTHFSRPCAELFNDLAGDALVTLGYEQDRNWVDKYEYVTA